MGSKTSAGAQREQGRRTFREDEGAWVASGMSESLDCDVRENRSHFNLLWEVIGKQFCSREITLPLRGRVV